MAATPQQILQAKLDAERKLKEGISGHKTGLPKKLLELFDPLEPVEYLPLVLKGKPKLPFTGVAQYVNNFVEPGDSEYEPAPPETCPGSPRRYANPEMDAQVRLDQETRVEKRARIAVEKVEGAKRGVEDNVANWDPQKDTNATGDPFKTLFVGRISYEATEKKLRREFEEFGVIKSVRLVHDKNTGKPRGYAFVEYEHKNDMKQAYKMADGRKVEGRRVLVDVERGRTVPNWRPRRLGGGKGGESRAPKEPKNPTKRALALAIASRPKTPPPPVLDKEADVDRDRERDRRERDERDEKDRERERERERAREKEAARDRRDRDKDRDRDRGRDMTRVPPPDANGRDRERHSSRDKDRERDRKRDRGERDRDDGRSSKRHREEERPRRRERDIL